MYPLRAVLLGLVLLTTLACRGEPDGRSAVGLSADPRFLLELHGVPTDSLSRLLLRIEPREGWKLVPESPARLRAEAPAGWSFEVAEQRSEDALEYSEKRLEFGLDLRSDSGASESPAEVAYAHLKFGVCRANSSHCEVVRERFELPIAPPRAPHS